MKFTNVAMSISVMLVISGCGGGGTGSDPITPAVQTVATVPMVNKIVPMKIFGTSYENKNLINFDQTQIPTVRYLNIPKVYSDEQDSNERSVTFGDFFQEGKHSVFVSSTRASNLYGIPNINDVPGVAYFLSKDANGNWKDRSNELLKSVDDRKTCISTSYSITADFNNDSKPDVYIACNGVDYDIRFLGFSLTELINRWSSNQIIFLSQSDGTYKRIEVPFQIYGHQAAAADINGDGNIDIITINALGGDYDNSVDRVSVLLGKGDGTFTQNNSIIPRTSALADITGMWNINLIPIDGRLDLVLAQDLFTIWIKGDKKGGFDWTSMKKFVMPISASKGTRYGTPLDVVYDNGYFYFYSTSQWDPAGAEWAIIKYSTDAINSSIIYTFDNPTTSMKPYSAQFKPTASGSFVAYSGGCAINSGGCAMNVKYK